MRRNIEQAIVEEEAERRMKAQRVKQMFKELDASHQVAVAKVEKIKEEDALLEVKNKAYH